MRRIELRVKGALSYPQSKLTAADAANPIQWPRERGWLRNGDRRTPKQIAILIAVLLGGLAQLVWTESFSSYFQSCINQERGEGPDAQAKTQNDSVAVVGLSFAHCTENFVDLHNPMITALATVLLTVVTGGLAWIGIVQQNTTRAQFRAHVLARDGVIYKFGTPNVIEVQVARGTGPRCRKKAHKLLAVRPGPGAVLEAAVTGFEPGKPYALASEATGGGALQSLQGFMTKPAARPSSTRSGRSVS